MAATRPSDVFIGGPIKSPPKFGTSLSIGCGPINDQQIPALPAIHEILEGKALAASKACWKAWCGTPNCSPRFLAQQAARALRCSSVNRALDPERRACA